LTRKRKRQAPGASVRPCSSRLQQSGPGSTKSECPGWGRTRGTGLCEYFSQTRSGFGNFRLGQADRNEPHLFGEKRDNSQQNAYPPARREGMSVAMYSNALKIGSEPHVEANRTRILADDRWHVPGKSRLSDLPFPRSGLLAALPALAALGREILDLEQQR
jgi:hypothetical protein